MRQVLRVEPTARDLPRPRDLRASLSRRWTQEGDDNFGVCSPGHSPSHSCRDQGDTERQPAPARVLGASPQRLHLLPAGPRCQASLCWGSAGAAGLHQKVSRPVGAGTSLPHFPCSGPCGHCSCSSGSAMLFQPLFALHSLLRLFFLALSICSSPLSLCII